jgi:glycine C-acetyltransferase
MYGNVKARLQGELDEIKNAGLLKEERILESAQGAEITVKGRKVLNFCANNYLGLANDKRLVDAAAHGMEKWGLGLSSVRFICGTQAIHKELEKKLSTFLGQEDTILYSSCWDANGGVFEIIMGEQDAIISDALNHASIIDGIRLSKAERHRYDHGDMAQLEDLLKKTADKRSRLIVTDGVFSMDGTIAKLKEICDLADKYNALLMVDDSHATGFFGPTGRGTPEHCGVQGRVDILNSTLGKALGGASGGFTSARAEIVALLRQRARPYLFSNTLAPPIVCSTLACIDLLSGTTALRDKLETNTKYFREAMTKAGFDIRPGVHPIVPIMIGDARLATEMAAAMLEEGIYVIGFSFPVVPKGLARIRVQLSAAHERAHLEKAVDAFTRVGRKVGVLK